MAPFLFEQEFSIAFFWLSYLKHSLPVLRQLILALVPALYLSDLVLVN